MLPREGMTAIIITIWLVTYVCALSVCLDMISAANTIENCIGLVLLVTATVISVRTRCFIIIIPKIKQWIKHSDSQSKREP